MAILGLPKEIKDNEYRVCLSPNGIKEFVKKGHKVVIEKNAGSSIGFDDEKYQANGAEILDSISDIYQESDIILKVKEPQLKEIKLIKKNQIIFSYLHLAADKNLTVNLLNQKPIAIAFETITDANGRLPLLKPMSAVAGRVAVQAASFSLQKNNGGNGLLLGGVENIKPCKVIILGGGVVGENAAFVASGMGADVTIVEKSKARINEVRNIYGNRFTITEYTDDILKKHLTNTDLLIGAILLPGKAAPKLLTNEHIKLMPKNSVFVDVAIDQGGCCSTSRATSHTNPTYIEEGVIHYCVTNMPAVAARTASFALEEAILPYLIKLTNNDIDELLKTDLSFRNGLNIYHDKITNKAVAESLNMEYSKL